MGLRSMMKLWRDRPGSVELPDAETMAWEVEAVLNSREASPQRPQDPHDVAGVLEGMPGYSPAATEILQRRGITGVVVVDDNQGMRYLVVCGQPDRKPPRRDLWSFLLPESVKIEARVGWRTWLSVEQYYVVPNFIERMSYYEDFALEGVREVYPVPANFDPKEFRIAIGPPKGEVYFREAAEALDYADDLRVAMQDRGILCSPVVGISGYTDHPRIARPMGDTVIEQELGEAPVPTPDEADINGVVFAVGYADHLERRCGELEARIRNPKIQTQREADLRRQLNEKRREAREAARRAREVPIGELAQVFWHLRAEHKKYRQLQAKNRRA